MNKIQFDRGRHLIPDLILSQSKSVWSAKFYRKSQGTFLALSEEILPEVQNLPKGHTCFIVFLSLATSTTPHWDGHDAPNETHRNDSK